MPVLALLMIQAAKVIETRFRYYRTVVAALALICTGSIPNASNVASACDLCEGILPHRQGPVAIKLTVEGTYFKVGEPILVDISLVNKSTSNIEVDFNAPVSQISLHLVTESLKDSEGDKSPRLGSSSLLGSSKEGVFKRVSLQQWGIPLNAVGKYTIEVSYQHVDSNPVTFWVAR
jgi:hypothetical protein